MRRSRHARPGSAMGRATQIARSHEDLSSLHLPGTSGGATLPRDDPRSPFSPRSHRVQPRRRRLRGTALRCENAAGVTRTAGSGAPRAEGGEIG